MDNARIQLTQGNVNNNHFYLTSCMGMFPSDVIGGRNKLHRAQRLLTLRPTGDISVETDIDGTKNIFRKRGWVASMFQRGRVKAGDFIVIQKDPDGSFRVDLESGGGVRTANHGDAASD